MNTPEETRSGPLSWRDVYDLVRDSHEDMVLRINAVRLDVSKLETKVEAQAARGNSPAGIDKIVRGWLQVALSASMLVCALVVILWVH